MNKDEIAEIIAHTRQMPEADLRYMVSWLLHYHATPSIMTEAADARFWTLVSNAIKSLEEKK